MPDRFVSSAERTRRDGRQALLPTILFTRSTLDADQFTNGLAFLFLALTFGEIAAAGRIARR